MVKKIFQKKHCCWMKIRPRLDTNQLKRGWRLKVSFSKSRSSHSRRFHDKVPAAPNIIKKETTKQAFSSEICKILQSSFFVEQLSVAGYTRPHHPYILMTWTKIFTIETNWFCCHKIGLNKWCFYLV